MRQLQQRWGWAPGVRSAVAGAALAGAIVAGCGTKPPGPGARGIERAANNKLHAKVRSLLKQSGQPDDRAKAIGEQMMRALPLEQFPAVKVRESECYFAGCYVDLAIDGKDDSEIDNSALAFNQAVMNDAKNPFGQLGGSRGRTAVLRGNDDKVFEMWFVLLKGRALSKETAAKVKFTDLVPQDPGLKPAGDQQLNKAGGTLK